MNVHQLVDGLVTAVVQADTACRLSALVLCTPDLEVLRRLRDGEELTAGDRTVLSTALLALTDVAQCMAKARRLIHAHAHLVEYARTQGGSTESFELRRHADGRSP